MCFIFNYSIS